MIVAMVIIAYISSQVRRMLSANSPVAGGCMTTEVEDSIEGTGLLAETMRKVDRSFRAKLVGGPSDDLGYQYFVEKVSICVVIFDNYCCHCCCIANVLY